MPLNFTKRLCFAAALILFLLTLEFAVPAWRNSAPVSDAPVFSWRGATLLTSAPPPFGDALKLYRADRGAEVTLPGPDSSSLTLFYFEWDQIDAGPMLDIAGHRPEECNVAAGFTLLSHNPKRSFETPDHSSLVFDATTFTVKSRRTVHIYKTAWLQGFGSREIREGENRLLRLKNSFTRGGGAARVIECGVSGAQDENQAWDLFQREVLDKLQWENR